MGLVLLVNRGYGWPALGAHVPRMAEAWGGVTVCYHERPAAVSRAITRVPPLRDLRDRLSAGRSGGVREVNLYGYPDHAVREVWGADADVLCCGFDRIISPGLLAGTRTAANIHPSLLPWYRGPDPAHWLVAHGETVSGVTLHEMIAGVDRGAPLARERFAIPEGATRATVDAAAVASARRLGLDYLARLRTGDRPAPIAPLAVCPYRVPVDYRGFP